LRIRGFEMRFSYVFRARTPAQSTTVLVLEAGLSSTITSTISLSTSTIIQAPSSYSATSERVSEGLTRRVSEGLTRRVSEGLTRRVSEGLTRRVSEGLTRRVSEGQRIPQNPSLTGLLI
jgi:hypothetical protein